MLTLSHTSLGNDVGLQNSTFGLDVVVLHGTVNTSYEQSGAGRATKKKGGNNPVGVKLSLEACGALH